jgi:hypothetical protein
MDDNHEHHEHPEISLFQAPSWAGDWCPRCDWAQTCTDCRAGWI